MKPIDLTLLAVTAGVGFMLFSLSRRATAASSSLAPFEQYLASPQAQNKSGYWGQYLQPGYLESQASKEWAWAIQNAPSSEGVVDPSQQWTVG